MHAKSSAVREDSRRGKDLFFVKRLLKRSEPALLSASKRTAEHCSKREFKKTLPVVSKKAPEPVFALEAEAESSVTEQFKSWSYLRFFVSETGAPPEPP